MRRERDRRRRLECALTRAGWAVRDARARDQASSSSSLLGRASPSRRSSMDPALPCPCPPPPPAWPTATRRSQRLFFSPLFCVLCVFRQRYHRTRAARKLLLRPPRWACRKRPLLRTAHYRGNFLPNQSQRLTIPFWMLFPTLPALHLTTHTHFSCTPSDAQA